MSESITIALTKGRILKETLPLLAEAGIEPLDDIGKSRKLIFDTTAQGVRLVVIRGTDVPTYVRHGAADVGVVGKDVLLEHGAEGVYIGNIGGFGPVFINWIKILNFELSMTRKYNKINR